ncbi:zinc ribbon domain-containing protein, partial [Candidatus Peregrinibacteria bacterium]|nr:zinc ribbon domain-containing protein [Candidatus Peregrinibacteria bacterium]
MPLGAFGFLTLLGFIAEKIGGKELRAKLAKAPKDSVLGLWNRFRHGAAKGDKPEAEEPEDDEGEKPKPKPKGKGKGKPAPATPPAAPTPAPSARAICPACGEENPADYAFCGECGAPST